MSLSVEALLILFFLVPGFIFVASVNFADRNIREVVFRGTLAEVAYVGFAAVTIHIGMSAIGLVDAVIEASLNLRFEDPNLPGSTNASTDQATRVAAFTNVLITYFLVSSVISFVFGFSLAKLIKRLNIYALAQHPWLLDLIWALESEHQENGGREQGELIFATVVTKRDRPASGFPIDTPETASDSHEPIDSAVVYHGPVYDCQFRADGTLTYIVFTGAQRRPMDLSKAKTFGAADDRSSRRGQTFSIAIFKANLIALPKTAVRILGWLGKLILTKLQAGLIRLNTGPDHSRPLNLLIIEGKEIRNVFFTKKRMTGVQEATDLLDEELRKLNSPTDTPS